MERSVPRGYRLAQLTAAFGLVVQPTLPMLVLHREEALQPGATVPAGVFFGLLAVAQAVALLWLRRSPRAARVPCSPWSRSGRWRCPRATTPARYCCLSR
ncbi:hypothetical protein ACR6C2_30515 [Streptomyces sp. INA 01156]